MKAAARRILVLGQTPPPYHGQAVMIQKLLDGEYRRIRLHHQRMDFSRTFDEIGRITPAKILRLPKLIARALFSRFRYGIDVLYYAPAGDCKAPVYRDLILLTAIRWCFRRTVFHFHSAGISQLVQDLPWPFRMLSRLAYGSADCAITLSELCSADAKLLQARKIVVIPNGVEDHCQAPPDRDDEIPTILYVGQVRPTKGVDILLEAARDLNERGLKFRLEFVGGFHSESYRRSVMEYVQRNGLYEIATFQETLVGERKWECYRRAAIFCFPTFFEQEVLSLVILEAMQFALPVIATRWRGLPDMVQDGDTGFLVPVRDSAAVAAKLEFLLANPARAAEMGEHGRDRYLASYTIERFRTSLEEVLASV